MAQDSIAYGESLLADVRKRNSEAERRERKDARRGEWKGLAAKIGMTIADNVFEQRQTAFLNNEQLMAQKLSMQKVDTEATTFNNTYQAAMKYDGGIEAWKRNEVEKMAAARLSQDYVDGTYSKADFNLLTKKVADGYYDTYSDEFDKRLKANQAYLTSGNTEAFTNAIASQAKSKGMTGTFLNKIGLGKITGNTQTDLLKVNPYEKNANAQKIFQDQYNQTRDAGLSEFIAKEFSKEGRMKLGRPSVQISDEIITMTSINSAGMETELKVQQATQGRRDGSVETFLINLDGSRYSLSSVQKLQDTLEFSTAASLQQQNKNIQAGHNAIQNLKAVDSNIIDSHIKDNLKDRSFYETDADYIAAADKKKATIAAYVTQGGIAAADQRTGWGTAKDGRKVQLALILDNMRSSNPKEMPVSGTQNPFETMFKIDQISTNLVSGNVGISRIVSNGVALYDHYHGQSDDVRSSIEDRFENMSFFKNPNMASKSSRARAEKTMEVVKIASELGLNPRDYGGRTKMLQTVDAELEEYRGRLAGKSNAAQTTQAVANATPAQGVTSLEELEAPVGPAYTRRGNQMQWTSPQHKDYAAIGSAVEEMEEIEIKLTDPRMANYGGAVPTLKKRLAEAKANVVALRNAYTKTYL
jgi:hypothetical protein